MRLPVAVIVAAMAFGTSRGVGAQELPTTPRDLRCDGSFLAAVKKKDTGAELKFDLEKKPVVTQVDREVADDLAILSQAYVSGDWNKAHGEAEKLLRKVATCPTVEFTTDKDTGKTTGTEKPRAPGTPRFDLAHDYVHLLWVSTVPASADPTVFSMVVHTPMLPPYSRVLPGLSGAKAPRLLEVFLSVNAEATIASYYVSKPLPDPLLEQVPLVVDRFLGPLFAQFDRLNPDHQLSETDTRQAKPPVIGYVVRRVELPEPRSSIEVTMRATQPITTTQLQDDLATLAVTMETQGLVGGFAGVYSQVFLELTQLIQEKPPAACHAIGSAAECKRALHKPITEIFAQARKTVTADPSRRDLDRFEAAMHGFVEGLKPTFVSGKTTLDNSPLTHLSFGLLSSYAFYVGGDDLRAKVEQGKVVNAPLPRALQMVVLNMAFDGYQSKTMKRYLPDPVLQPFAGVVFSPDPGLTTGLSVRVLGNIGINFGYAYMFIARPEQGLDFGSALDEKVKDEAGKDTAAFRYPVDLRQDPLQSGRLHTLFIGASYNFK